MDVISECFQSRWEFFFMNFSMAIKLTFGVRPSIITIYEIVADLIEPQINNGVDNSFDLLFANISVKAVPAIPPHLRSHCALWIESCQAKPANGQN